MTRTEQTDRASSPASNPAGDPCPLIHTTGFVAAPVPVYFETFGPTVASGKPTVVMVHGGAHTGACYQRTADGRPGWAYRFVQRGYKVVVPDWPGIGRSGYIPPDQLVGEVVVRGLGALIEHLGVPVVLLTHSMSGCYGWRLLERHGDRIAAVVGVAPSPPGNIQPQPKIFHETDTTIEIDVFGRRTRLDKTAPSFPAADFIERKLVGDSTYFPRELMAAYAAGLCPLPHRIALERQNVRGSQIRVDNPARLAGKRVLVVTGSADIDHARDVDGAIVTWLNDQGARAEFCFLADRGIVGNGHMLMLEKNSDDIAALIMDWLETDQPRP